MQAAASNGILTIPCPPTEGVKYAGSKLRLLPHILQLARQVDARTIFDGFAGTTRVSQAFARLGYRVIANDSAVFSKVFAQCYLLNQRERAEYQALIDHLNALPPVDGWFTEHYGGDCDNETPGAVIAKKPWQRHNTRKLDAIRQEIDNLRLSEIERSVLLTSLMLALDQVDSTLGHFASYLSQWSPRSYRTLKLTVPRLISPCPTIVDEPHEVYQADIFDLVDCVQADLAYYDPPYGSNNEKMPPSRVRYAAYYHLWTTICLNDRPPLFGKAGRRADSSDTLATSVFEEYRKNDKGKYLATEAIRQLIQRTRARYIILSYSSGGRTTAAELYELLTEAGKILAVQQIDYRRNVMAAMRWTNQWVRDAESGHYEYLFLLEK